MRRHLEVPMANSYNLIIREKSRAVSTMSFHIFLQGVDRGEIIWEKERGSDCARARDGRESTCEEEGRGDCEENERNICVIVDSPSLRESLICGVGSKYQ